VNLYGGFSLVNLCVISFVRRVSSKMLPYHAPALTAGEIQAALGAVQNVGDLCDVYEFRLTAASGNTGAHVHRISGKVIRHTAADRAANPPVLARVEIEVTQPLNLLGNKLVIPPAEGQVEVIKLSFKVAEANPYKAMYGNMAYTHDFRNPRSLTTYIVCRDGFSSQDQLARFDNDIRQAYRMNGRDDRTANSDGYDTMRFNGLLRLYRSWVLASQKNTNWNSPENLQVALEIVQEMEQCVMLDEEMLRPGKHGSEAVYKRALQRWRATVLIYESMKPEEQDWSRAVLLGRQKASK